MAAHKILYHWVSSLEAARPALDLWDLDFRFSTTSSSIFRDENTLVRVSEEPKTLLMKNFQAP